MADDLLFPLAAEGGELMCLPYSIELNDTELVLRQHLTGEQYRQRLVDEFEQLCRDADAHGVGRVMAIPLHPFLAGQAHQIRYLHDALVDIASSNAGWMATGADILEHYRTLAAP